MCVRACICAIKNKQNRLAVAECILRRMRHRPLPMGPCSSRKLSRRHDDFLRTCSGYNGLSTLISKTNQMSLICPMKTTECDVFAFNSNVRVVCSPKGCTNWFHILEGKIEQGIFLVKEKRNNSSCNDSMQ